MNILGVKMQEERDYHLESMQDALISACDRTGLAPERILGSSRDAETVRARRLLAHDLRKMGYSYPEIGRFMGRHHTTIIHLVKNLPRRERMKFIPKEQANREALEIFPL